MDANPNRMDPHLQLSSHEDLLAEHIEAARLALEQSLQTICHRMHKVAYESARLTGDYLDQLQKETKKMHSTGGTGDAPALNTSLRGAAWVEQPVRPQAFEEMRITTPIDVAPLIEMPSVIIEGADLEDPAKDISLRAHDADEKPNYQDDEDSEESTPRIRPTMVWKGSAAIPARGDSGRRVSTRKVDGNIHEPRSVFADANAMKEKVRAAVAETEYNVADFYFETGICQFIARSQVFEYLTLFVIAFNAIWISIDTDNNDALTLKDAPLIFQIAENGFCVYFTLEWLIRFLSFEKKRNCIRDAWFCFDTVLVAIMIAETWVMNAVILLTSDGEGSSGALGNTSVLKLFRLVRLTRMARMAKLLRAIPELIILIKGIAVASRSVVFTLILLCVILYFFAIVFRQLTDDTELGHEFFGSVTDSMGSLLLEGVVPDQSSIIRSCFASHWGLGVLSLLFVLLATLTVMNMLVGILCQIVSVVSTVEKEELTVTYVKNRLMVLFKGADSDHSCKICKEEFNVLLAKREAALIIREIGVDVVGLVDFADFIFEEQEELSFGDFMELVLSLRGSNMATVKDIIDLRKFTLTTMKAELSHWKNDICKEIEGKVNGAAQAKRLSNGNALGVAWPLPVPRPVDAVNGVSTHQQMRHNQASTTPQPKPKPVPKDRQRPFSGPTPTITTDRTLARHMPLQQARAQSANAKMRGWDGPAPPLPTFPKCLPLDATVEEEEITGNEGVPQNKLRDLRVGTVSDRRKA